MVTTTNYTGPNYGPKEGMAYTAVMPQEGFQYTYDQDGTRYQIPIGKPTTPPGPISPPEGRLVDAPNTTVLPEAALQPSMQEQAGGRKVISVIDTLLNTPSLPTGAMVTPQLQQVQTGEAMATPGVQGTVAAATPTPGTTPTVTAATVPGATMAAQ